MEKRREIDFANVLLCILVMLIHILSRSVSSLDKMSIQYLSVLIPSRLASFVVQGFIFLSSMKYFMKYNESDFNYVSFLKSRIKTVVLPYILWNIIYYYALIPLGYFSFDLGQLIKYILLGNMISHFYFVVVIMQFYLLMPLWFWLFKIVNKKILLIGSFILMIWFGQYIAAGFKYNDRIFLKYIFYWIAGGIAGRNIDKFFGIVQNYKKGILVLFISVAMLDSILTYKNNIGTYILGLENIHVFYCLISIMFVFAMCGKCVSFVDNKIFGVINRQSYNIYLSHCLVLYYVDYIVNEVGYYSVGTILVIRFVMCYTITYLLWRAYDILMAKRM